MELFDTQAIDQISVCHYSRAHHAIAHYTRTVKQVQRYVGLLLAYVQDRAMLRIVADMLWPHAHNVTAPLSRVMNSRRFMGPPPQAQGPQLTNLCRRA